MQNACCTQPPYHHAEQRPTQSCHPGALKIVQELQLRVRAQEAQITDHETQILNLQNPEGGIPGLM